MANKKLILIGIAALLLPVSAFAAITLTGNVKIVGTLTVTGTFSKGSGHFEIDDPLDPAGKILVHTFLESNEVKNLYDGVTTLDKNGEATIQLPDYFMSLNKDFRYEFGPLGQAMPDLYLKSKVSGDHFTISGGAPGGKISWQVTGVRHDPYILAHPVINEVAKGPGQPVKRGECIYTPLCEQ